MLKVAAFAARTLASHTEKSSATNQPQPNQGFPAVPSSLNPSDHEMRDWPPNYSPPADTIPYYTPYLGLRARLSQVWINRWTVLLILIICRLLLATKDLDSNLSNAKSEALSACTSVEKVGSAMASMPHYMSAGVNVMAADGITKAVNAMMSMLLMSVTAVEEIVLFVIHMMTSTYLCLITLAVSGSLHVALDVIEKVGDFMNKTIEDITGGMTTSISDFQGDFNKFLSAINIGGIFGSSKDPPKIDLTSAITKLQTIQIDPTAMDTDIAKLNASIPNFDQVQNFTDTVISFPFEEVKKLINESMVAYKFDKSVFPVAQKEALTFCSDSPAIDNFFGGLTKTVKKSKTVFLVILTIAAILVCIPMAYREIWRWCTMQQRAVALQQNALDPIDVVYIASRPLTSSVGINLSSKFQASKKQILVRWFVSYATTLPALLVLALGLAGLFSCLCQYIVLKVIEKEVPALAGEVGNFSGTVVLALNNASTAWARGANTVINSTNTQINDDVFGWVNTTTTAINNTLIAFTNEMGDALNATFGGTILYDPIKEVLNCLIGLKIAGVEKGLTWVSDHAQVTLPEFDTNVFSRGAAASIASNSSATDSFLSSPGSAASDDITGAVIKVSTKLKEAIKEEVFISLALVGVYVLIVLMGLGRVLFGLLGRDKTRAEGGPVGYTGDNRVPISPREPDRGSFPNFGAPVSSIYPTVSHEDAWASGGLHNEKLGTVTSVEASVRPGHERASSYGYMDGKR